MFIELGEGAARKLAGETEQNQIYRNIVLLAETNQKTRALTSKQSKELIPRFVEVYTDPDNQFLARGAPNMVRINSDGPEGVKHSGFTIIEQVGGGDWYGFIVDVSITESPNPTVSDISDL